MNVSPEKSPSPSVGFTSRVGPSAEALEELVAQKLLQIPHLKLHTLLAVNFKGDTTQAVSVAEMKTAVIYK